MCAGRLAWTPPEAAQPAAAAATAALAAHPRLEGCGGLFRGASAPAMPADTNLHAPRPPASLCSCGACNRRCARGELCRLNPFTRRHQCTRTGRCAAGQSFCAGQASARGARWVRQPAWRGAAGVHGGSPGMLPGARPAHTPPNRPRSSTLAPGLQCRGPAFFRTSNLHCGRCDRQCLIGQDCVGGQCVTTHPIFAYVARGSPQRPQRAGIKGLRSSFAHHSPPCPCALALQVPGLRRGVPHCARRLLH